jgi:AraC-like DNA-binding protein
VWFFSDEKDVTSMTPPTRPTEVIEASTFRRIRRQYRQQWGFTLCAVDAEGTRVAGSQPCAACKRHDCREARRHAAEEALRWGEPSVGFCPANRLLWAVPLMDNQRIGGALVASASEKDVFQPGDRDRPIDLQRACTALRELAEQENLTNASALELRRRDYEQQQQRAYALHDFKRTGQASIRELYLREEPALFAAIRSGDRGAAREILNRILVAIHHHAGNRLEVIQSFFMELVVTMCRTAVVSGGAPEDLLGSNYTSMTALAEADTEEKLAHWLSRTLERIMDNVEANRTREPGQLLFDAVAYMQRHCGQRISRDEVAEAVHVSPSHFSHLLRKESGSTFTELLNRMRVDRSAELLTETDKPLSLIALECGFRDQSYFTKVFRKHLGQTPGQYRRSHQGP